MDPEEEKTLVVERLKLELLETHYLLLEAQKRIEELKHDRRMLEVELETMYHR